MVDTPPASPHRSRSPFVLSSQHPQYPFQSTHQMQHRLWPDNSQPPSNVPVEKGIPTLISWYLGGDDVAVEGSWDNWTSRKDLYRSGKEHSILLVLPSGTYHYKFIVDGEWRFIPDLPHMADVAGQTVNILQVSEFVAENLESIAEFAAPPSPDSSYDRLFPGDDDFAKEPPVVPPQLPLALPNWKSLEAGSSPRRPHHVELNHLYIQKGWASQSLVALHLTHRFHSKYVTVALYKPLNK
ncbi:hypothetical protein HPP92_015433 [Vanilla planifolia]|uniref:Association with the SNF1 complex (ASC) domain-containing protein n=1 Tax=Vanilla planifolia TaxID=51239 RepID=A0A835UVP4_VANPL|nr:hypothetical protein HPP92_015433 [Vanilla planifolia]